MKEGSFGFKGESGTVLVAGAGGGLVHGDAGLIGAYLAGELVHGPEQGLPSQVVQRARL